MKIWVLLSVITFLALGLSPVCTAQNETPSYTVRVAVLTDAATFPLTVKGAYKLLSSDVVVDTRDYLATVDAAAAAKGIRIGEDVYPHDRLTIIPANDATIVIGQRRFRGHVRILKIDGKLLVINDVELEQYIKGVLYHEVSHRWPLEAIKAQAVATRTYALYTRTYRRNNEFDMTNDIYSQVYGGRNSERYRTNMAVNRTKGQILTYEGKLFPAYFHATCAGRTEDASELWNVDVVPLKGVACPFCRHSPHFSWKKNYRLKNIQDAFNAKGFQLGLIKEIRVTERNPSGRIRNLEILTRDGKKETVTGKQFREIVGPNEVRSNNYVPEMHGYYMDLVGQGWGHGVGLCQWGAFGMSRLQYDYKEILAHYYPGADIVPFTKVKEDLQIKELKK